MRLSAGTRLGPYEILSALGAGGMGEVYRARDTKLDRAVAIKILPEAFAADTERVARFQREARTLASLNHPNIAHVHGLEESSGVRALVMELVEGEDLAERIARGAIPVDEALPIAKQIADALEAAHEQGIIHRDLKPANIKVRPDGTVKVLDFGLAKAMEPTGDASPSVSQSPTITTPAMTEAGMILGTAAYMSPEQARGKPVDKRADIWAFGCVLYEMLTGGGRSTGRVSRKRWRASSSVSRTGTGCRRRCRPRCAHTSGAACRRIRDSGCRPSATSGWRWRARSRRLFRRRPRQRLSPIGGASHSSVSPRSSSSGAIIGTMVWVAMRQAEPAAASCLAPANRAPPVAPR